MLCFDRYAARQQANLAPLYFLAFMVFGSMVMLNLFIAVVIVSGLSMVAPLRVCTWVSKCCVYTLYASVWGTHGMRAFG
jgi:hypothetical protein